MAIKAGKSGKVMQGANTLVNVKSWKLDIKDTTIDYTGLGATARVFTPLGLTESSGSVEWTALDMAGTGEAALVAGILAGTSMALKLYEDDTKYWDITSAYLENFATETSVDGLVTGSFDFKCAAAPAYT